MTDSEPTRPLSVAAQAASDLKPYLRSYQSWLLTASACLLSGFGGPFGTNEIMPLGIRLLFWTLVLTIAILTMAYLSFLTQRINLRLGYHRVLASAVAGALGTPVILTVVVTVYWTLLPNGPGFDLGVTLLEVGVPTIIVNIVVNGLIRLPDGPPDPRAKPLSQAVRRSDPTVTTPLPEDQSLLFDALPPEIGRDIVSIRADDHYIEIRTPQGQARILMRLRDAEAALAALPGLRVHRSWWLNLDHVTALEVKSGGSGVVTLDTGETVPVSRGQVAAVERALAARR